MKIDFSWKIGGKLWFKKYLVKSSDEICGKPLANWSKFEWKTEESVKIEFSVVEFFFVGFQVLDFSVE